MKVLYDWRPWQDFHGRGVARYIDALFMKCMNLIDEEAFILLKNNKQEPDFSAELEKKVHLRYQDDLDREMFSGEEFDVFISGSACRLNMSPETVLDEMYPHNVLKLCRHRTVILYDFIPLFFQDYLWDEFQKVSFALQSEMLRTFDHVFTISKFTAASAIRYIPLPREKLSVIYGGVDVKKFCSENSLSPYSVGNRKNHIVYVGGFASQKNWQGAVKAFCMAYNWGLIPADAAFYIICNANQGCKDALKELTESHGLVYGKQILATGFVSDAEMENLISTARASIFPSFLEGLGLPILESYAAGTPCWASAFHAAKEITFPACTFNPFEESSMIRAFADIYARPDLCQKSLEFGHQLLKEISWEKAAAKVVSVFERLSAGTAGNEKNLKENS